MAVNLTINNRPVLEGDVNSSLISSELTVNTYAGLSAKRVVLTGILQANLPAASGANEGQIRYVTDDAGATLATLVFSNGANWFRADNNANAAS